MKLQEGVVEDFNGYTGRILSEGKKYVLTDTNIIKGNDIKNGDAVTFVAENSYGLDMARFVKIKKKSNAEAER